MKTRQCYLKSNIKSEPLIWNWYAWTHLIPPITAGCNIAERHMKIMESYIQAPQLHIEAVQNPQLLGGPFIDLGVEYVNQVKELLVNTQKDCSSLIELASNLKSLDKMLLNEADGGSLENYYNQVPENLRGLVELVYDLNNHPSIRLIEPLIYKKYYDERSQSLALSISESDARSFVLSTPRFENNKELQLKIPFSDERLDILFKSRYQSHAYDDLLTLFEIPQHKESLFSTLFSETPPILKVDRNFQGDGIRMRYFGHACILLETKKTSILIDPIISYESLGDGRYTYGDLPDTIDYILLTHNHQDHVLFETLLQLRHKIKNIIVPGNLNGSLSDPSLKLILKYLGFKSIIVIEDFDEIEIPEGRITGIPFLGEHSDLNIQTKTAYHIDLKGKKFLFGADSNNLESKLYEHVFNFLGSVDAIFIGMECEGAPLSWLYGPLLTNPLKRSYDITRCLSGSNFEKAWDIVRQSGCKQAYIYAMGQEPWLSYIMTLAYTSNSPQIIESDKFIHMCHKNGIESERLFIKKELIL